MNFLKLFAGTLSKEDVEPRTKRIFLHIPKCGGSSLHKLLYAQFPVAKVCPIRHNRLDEMRREVLSKYELYSGHFTWDAVERFIHGSKSYVTILRDPVGRLLSSYYFGRSHTWAFVRKHPQFSEPPTAYELHGMAYRPAKELELRAYLESEAKHLSGLMVRWIGGGQGSADEMLSRAKLRLSQMDSVGLVEDMEASVADIFAAWNLPCPSIIPRELDQSRFGSTHPWLEIVEKQEITSAISDRLQEICQLDQELYEYAQQLVAFRRSQRRALVSISEQAAA